MGASQAFASQPTCLIFRAAMASRRSVRIITDGSKLGATLVSRLKISTVVATPTRPPRLHHRSAGRFTLSIADTSFVAMNRLALLAMSTVLGVALAARAMAADFYAGKTINFIAGTDTGGGFSIYARLIAKHLARFIPGGPTIVVKNMPGAGGSTAAAYLYRVAPKDGTTILSVSPNAILGKLLDETQTQYDPTRFLYLAGAERSTRLCMTFQHSKIRNYEDALGNNAVIGATSAGSPTREYAAWHKHATGTKFEIVSGYKGPPDLFIAMERGEIDGVCGLDWSALK